MAESRTAERICPQCGTETPSAYCRIDGFATVGRSRFPGGDVSLREGETLVGRYRLDQALGSGPLGVAYRATDLRLGSPLHVRVLPPGLSLDLRVVARFQREGRLVASLAHPNIVRVHEHGVTEDGALFIAQELILGPTLREVLAKEGPLDPQRVVAIGHELFDALVEAHTHGVPHRSLALDNVVLHRRPDGSETVKVSQFGLARVLADDESTPFVWPNALVSAWGTMAPEQARGRGVSGHADLYSVGAMLYELLTGRSVFSEVSPSDLLVAHSVKIARPPERADRILVGPLIDVIMRCLEKKPWNRPDGAQKALDMLEAARNQPLLPSPTAFGAVPASEKGKGAQATARVVGPPTQPQALSPPSRQTKRDTNPYAVQPAMPQQVPVAYPASHPLVAPVVAQEPVSPAKPANPPSARSRHVTQPSPVGPGASLSPSGVSRTGRDTRLDMSLSNGVQAGSGSDPLSPFGSRGAAHTSDVELVIRSGPSPVVAFLLGLIVAGALGGLGYFLIFGGKTSRDADPVAGVGQVAAGQPHPAAAAERSEPSEPVGQAVVADASSPNSEPEVDVQAAVVAETSPGGAQAGDAGPTVDDTLVAMAGVAVAAPDTTLVAGNTVAPQGEKPPPAVPKTAPETVVDRPRRELPPPRREAPHVAPVDPLADLEDPDFVNRPTPVTLRKVLVDSEPIGAKVAVRGQIIGDTPIYVEWDEASGGVDIVVSKVGYQPIRTRLSAGVGRAVRLNLKASP